MGERDKQQMVAGGGTDCHVGHGPPRNDKNDSRHCEERSTRKGYAASVRQQSCQRLRSDVAIRSPQKTDRCCQRSV